MLQKIRYFLFLTVVLLLIVVAFKNHDDVPINLLVFSGQYPLSLVLLATSVVSFLLGVVWTVWRGRKREKAKLRKTDASPQSAAKEPAAKTAKPDAVDELTK
jgi:uncharacterized integral membrane protein